MTQAEAIKRLEDESPAWSHDTNCNWKSCATPDQKPDFISQSGSCYWILTFGIIRQSTHWGSVASCWWLLDNREWRTPISFSKSPQSTMTGFASWNDFRNMKLDRDAWWAMKALANIEFGV